MQLKDPVQPAVLNQIIEDNNNTLKEIISKAQDTHTFYETLHDIKATLDLTTRVVLLTQEQLDQVDSLKSMLSDLGGQMSKTSASMISAKSNTSDHEALHSQVFGPIFDELKSIWHEKCSEAFSPMLRKALVRDF